MEWNLFERKKTRQIPAGAGRSGRVESFIIKLQGGSSRALKPAGNCEGGGFHDAGMSTTEAHAGCHDCGGKR